jgi:hypothetical protein
MGEKRMRQLAVPTGHRTPLQPPSMPAGLGTRDTQPAA